MIDVLPADLNVVPGWLYTDSQYSAVVQILLDIFPLVVHTLELGAILVSIFCPFIVRQHNTRMIHVLSWLEYLIHVPRNNST